VLQGQAAAAMQLAAGRVQQLGLVASHDTKEVDATHNHARRRQKVRVVLAKDAVEEGSELDGFAWCQREALGTRPNENR
jgi:hypothetical protein